MGSKSRPKAPDYSGVAAANAESARIAERLGNRQLDFAQLQYDQLFPLFQEISGTQMDAMRQQMGMAQDSYDYQRGFRDVEQQLVNQAQRFNTDAYREETARQAKADTERAFGLQEDARERQMASMGVNPNSGRFQGLSQAQDTQQAAMSAAAMNATRERARDRGTQMLSGAAGLGRGMQSSLAAYSGALDAGNSAGRNAMAPGQNYANQYGAGANTIMTGRQNYMGNALKMTEQQASIYNNYEDPWGAVLGLGGQLGAAAIGAGLGPFGR